MTMTKRRGPPTVDTYRRRLATARQPKCRCGNCLSLERVTAGVSECPACERQSEEWMRMAAMDSRP